VKILAIETSTEACSAALLNDQCVNEKYQLAPRQHGQLILSMIDALLIEGGVKLAQIDVLAFGRGPGSFTGVRMAASVIQGLACATQLSVVPISTLQALAQTGYRELGASAVLAAIDARMQEVYWGAFYLNEQQLMMPTIQESVVAPVSVIIPTGKNWTGVGSAWDPYHQQLSQCVGKQLQAVYPKQYPHAQDVALLARYELSVGNVVTCQQALPVYLRDQVTQQAYNG